MLRLAIITLLCLSTVTSFSTTNEIDSLKKELDAARNVDKFDLYIQLGEAYSRIEPQQTIDYGNKALELNKLTEIQIARIHCLIGKGYANMGEYDVAFETYDKAQKIYESEDNPSGVGSCISAKGTIVYYQGELEKALRFLENALEYLDEDNTVDQQPIARTFNSLALVYHEWSNSTKALEFFGKALNIYEKINDDNGIARTYNNIGIIYEYLTDYETAIQYYNKSLTLKDSIGDKYGAAQTLNNIGVVYNNWENYEKAIEYYDQSLNLYLELNNHARISIVYNNLGVVSKEMNQFGKALDYFNKAIEINKKIGNKQGISDAYNNMGTTYNDLKNFQKALDYYQKALNIEKETGRQKSIAELYNNIGFMHYKLGRLDEAENLFKEGLYLAKTDNWSKLMFFIYENLSAVYAAKGDYEKAFEYHSLYAELKDSVYDNEKHLQFNELQTRFETQKKEKEIRLLNAENELNELKLSEQQNEIEFQKKTKNTFIMLFSAILISLVFIILKQIQTNRANKYLVKQNLEVVKKENELLSAKEKVEPIVQNLEDTDDEEKYQSSALSDENKKKYAQAIIDLMENKKVFLNRKLTIDDIALELNTNRSYISQITNEYFSSNFNNFVNEYRIKEARRLLSDHQYENLSIEGIANTVGFNSKSSFNIAFKKFTGLTPSYFQKSVREGVD